MAGERQAWGHSAKKSNPAASRQDHDTLLHHRGSDPNSGRLPYGNSCFSLHLYSAGTVSLVQMQVWKALVQWAPLMSWTCDLVVRPHFMRGEIPHLSYFGALPTHSEIPCVSFIFLLSLGSILDSFFRKSTHLSNFSFSWLRYHHSINLYI